MLFLSLGDADLRLNMIFMNECYDLEKSVKKFCSLILFGDSQFSCRLHQTRCVLHS